MQKWAISIKSIFLAVPNILKLFQKTFNLKPLAVWNVNSKISCKESYAVIYFLILTIITDNWFFHIR